MLKLQGDAPRKLSKIFAAFSASPGRENVWTNSRELLASLVPLLCIKAVACKPAFLAPLRNLSKAENLSMLMRTRGFD